MNNIADLIENYILHKLSRQQNQKIELKRSDIASDISCAPSQISYVLSTRFTQERGFVVESRRGLGGFIRIVRLPLEEYIFQEMHDNLHHENTIEDLENMINTLRRKQAIEKREAAILVQTIHTIYPIMDGEERTRFIRSILNTLVNFT